ncbi:K02A2.6-like [Cordylochernes scorpioides]|uniref:K02A2.6-like n=1 Tax=Cordylochernes scorpioides TaxID=51811 RepID=A0ABY6LQQ6_9ARAC|nr:K02A2.6-like [Cordylochernes scorpioides]
MHYDFDLEYVPGKLIRTADTLSRDSISVDIIDTSDLVDLQNHIMTLNLKVTTKRYQEILRDMDHHDIVNFSKGDSTSVKIYLARNGVPEIIITDNGEPFTSQGFANFTNECDIEYKPIA